MAPVRMLQRQRHQLRLTLGAQPGLKTAPGVGVSPVATILRATTKSVFFRCSKCGSDADAPPGTERSQQLVCRQCYGRGKDKRPRELNDLTGAEWARASRSIEVYPD